MENDKNGLEDYQAITETNKKQLKKLKLRKVIKKCFFSILYGVLFGACAFFATFTLYKNFIEKGFEEKIEHQIEKNTRERLSLIKDQQQEQTEAVKQEETAAIIETEEGTESESTPQQIYITEEQALTPEQYQVLYNKLIYSATTANKAVVNVYNVKRLMDIFDMPYESSINTEGLVIAKDGYDIYVLVNSSILKKNGELFVMAKDSYLPAEIVGKSDIWGIAVLKCDLSNIDEYAIENVEVATITQTASAYTGKFVLATGSPRGIAGETLFGAISAIKPDLPVTDSKVTALVADMSGNSESGFLTDINGQFIGMFLPHLTSQITADRVCAVSIGDMQPVIEKLMNEEELLVLGLDITDIPSAALPGEEIPAGVFVRSVEVDSLAFESGIKNGDIISSINGMEITDMDGWKEYFYALNAEDELTITVERSAGDHYENYEIKIK